MQGRDNGAPPSAPASVFPMTQLSEPDRLDADRMNAFARRMAESLNGAGVSLMASLGHQTGLFDAMAALPPSTSARIAEAAGLHERYVREWLAAMTTAGVVVFDAAADTYWLPPEHAASLTRASGPHNLALLAQYVGLMASVEEPVAACFRRGSGVSYTAIPRFQKIQAEISAARVDGTLLDDVLPLVPGLVDRLSAGISAADVGCGRGHALNVMARAFPRSRFFGFDLSRDAIAAARQEAETMRLSNVRYDARDASTFNAVKEFELVTAFDAVHVQPQPARLLRAIAAALRPGGVFLMAEPAASTRLEENLDHPLGSLLYALSVMHGMTVSLAAGGEGLGTMWGEQKARAMLAQAGFKNVVVERIDRDATNQYFIATSC